MHVVPGARLSLLNPAGVSGWPEMRDVLLANHLRLRMLVGAAYDLVPLQWAATRCTPGKVSPPVDLDPTSSVLCLSEQLAAACSAPRRPAPAATRVGVDRPPLDAPARGTLTPRKVAEALGRGVRTSARRLAAPMRA
jgi:hypothetical protein